ncbi:MAG: hypothetical protein ACFFG0_51140 [Candidatus Thorarchaeota archaeon]
MSGKKIELDICPECGGKIELSDDEWCCKNCGLVSNRIFTNSFCRTNDLNKNYGALGEGPDSLGGLGSFIDYEKSKFLKDKNGEPLATKERNLYKRLKKKYEKISKIKTYETKDYIFNILNNVSLHFKLNKSIRNNAAYFYKKIITNEKIIENISLLAFCLFHTVRLEKSSLPISLNDITKVFQKFGYQVSSKVILQQGKKYKHYLSRKPGSHKSEE